MSRSINIESISHWNTKLKEAKETNRPVIVSFFVARSSSCKTIAITFDDLASRHPNAALFLKVDADEHKAIALDKYNITITPTIVVIKPNSPGGIADMVRGADHSALAAMVAKHCADPTPQPPAWLPLEAERTKAEGNRAFGAREYERAVQHYSYAIELAPAVAVLYGNRAQAYINLVKSPPDGVGESERAGWRVRAVEDAHRATTLDQRWAKGWVRMGEAMVLSAHASLEGRDERGEEARRRMLEGALQALENATRLSVGLADQKMKTEAQRMSEDVQRQLDGRQRGD